MAAVNALNGEVFQMATTTELTLIKGDTWSTWLMLILGDDAIATRGIETWAELNIERCAFVAHLLGPLIIIDVFFVGPVCFVDNAQALIQIGQMVQKLFLALRSLEPDLWSHFCCINKPAQLFIGLDLAHVEEEIAHNGFLDGRQKLSRDSPYLLKKLFKRDLRPIACFRHRI